MKEIITDIDKMSEICTEIDIKKENKLLSNIILELKDIIREKNLVALAANQIGYNKRVFVINFNGDLKTIINPMMGDIKGLDLSRETCPSLPGREFIRIRNNDIRVMYQTPLGKIMDQRFTGRAAFVFQQMFDAIEGVFLSDIGLEIDENYDKASDEEKIELINAYLDSLDLKQKELEREVESNEDLKKISDAIKFEEAIRKGDVEVKQQSAPYKDNGVTTESGVEDIDISMTTHKQ